MQSPSSNNRHGSDKNEHVIEKGSDHVPDDRDIQQLSESLKKTGHPSEARELNGLAIAEAQHSPLERLAKAITRGAGSTTGFVLAILFITTWIFCSHSGRSDEIEWRDSISMITLLMTFLIQRQSNKNMAVMQLKLDEIIASNDGANNGLIKAEDATEEIITKTKKNYKALAAKHRDGLAS